MAIDVFIAGIPYGGEKERGNIGGPREWSRLIIEKTRDLPKLTSACSLQVEFFLPADKFPRNNPFGSDLDNLLRNLLNALTESVLAEAPGGDGSIVHLTATKT